MTSSWHGHNHENCFKWGGPSYIHGTTKFSVVNFCRSTHIGHKVSSLGIKIRPLNVVVIVICDLMIEILGNLVNGIRCMRHYNQRIITPVTLSE